MFEPTAEKTATNTSPSHFSNSPKHQVAPLIEASNVKKHFTVTGSGSFFNEKKIVYAVDGVSLRVWPGESIGIVGESGCGKSTLARCLVRLYSLTSGQIRLQGKDISTLKLRDLRSLRCQMQMIFQDPSSSLNPRHRVGNIIAEPIRVHQLRPKNQINKRVMELMKTVGLRQEFMDHYPHELSGGQRQRVGVARALAVEPQLIVADESVSALDVSIQAQIVNLLSDLQERLNISYIFISHDLSVVRQLCNYVIVMYLGRIVETGPTELVYHKPAHPYTSALISAVPTICTGDDLSQSVLEGDLPSPMAPPAGCPFHPRCPIAQDICSKERPEITKLSDGREVACHFPSKYVSSAIV